MISPLAWRLRPLPVPTAPIVVEVPEAEALASLAGESDGSLAFLAVHGDRAALAMLLQRAAGGQS